MQKFATLTIKGTRFYKAQELFEKGELYVGLPLRLRHQPNNQSDKNAVGIYIKRSGKMLGHVSRDIAPKYANLANSGNIIEASISSVTESSGYINIDVHVAYEENEPASIPANNSSLWLSASSMPSTPGVYAIRNISTGREYIGSSVNLINRIKQHARELENGRHVNHVLQADFTRFGSNGFEASVLLNKPSASEAELRIIESDKIKSLLYAGVSLYNLTEDGQGTGTWLPPFISNTESISDVYAKKLAERKKQEAEKLRLEALRKPIPTTQIQTKPSSAQQNNPVQAPQQPATPQGANLWVGVGFTLLLLFITSLFGLFDNKQISTPPAMRPTAIGQSNDEGGIYPEQPVQHPNITPQIPTANLSPPVNEKPQAPIQHHITNDAREDRIERCRKNIDCPESDSLKCLADELIRCEKIR